MINRVLRVLVILVAVVFYAGFSQGGEAVDQTGDLDGTLYRIRIPAEWNGGLVMYCHGYKPRGGTWNPLADVIASVFLDRGFALAESAYSRQGWAVEEALAQTEALRAHFVSTNGEPDPTFVTGHSMGGLITLATIESFPDDYDGAMPMCGPLAPALVFFGDYIFDMLVMFDALFGENLPQEARPVVEAPLLGRQNVETALASDSTLAEACAAGWGIRREELAGIISLYHMLYRELADRAGGNPIDNRNTVYNDFFRSADLNALIARYEAVPEAMEYLSLYYTPTAVLGDPVLAVHTTYDAGVPPCVPGYYDASTKLLDGGKWFVQMYVESDGHCNFTAEQTGKAFDMLRAWVSTGKRPESGVIE